MSSVHNSLWAIMFASISLSTTRSADNAANSFSDRHSLSLQATVDKKMRLEQFFTANPDNAVLYIICQKAEESALFSSAYDF